MNRIVLRVGLILLTTSGLLLLWFSLPTTLVVAEGSAAPPATPGVRATPTPVLGPESLEGVTMVLLAPNGQVDLRDTPGGIRRFTVPAGTLVRVIDWVALGHAAWYLVEREGGARGWVPAEAVAPPGKAGPAFGRFAFCEGSAAAPGATCGALLSLAAEGLWARWSYAGLKPNDQVQYVLVLNGERYQQPPFAWRGPAAGEQLLNLRAFGAPAHQGLWMLWIVVNGELASVTSVRVR